MALAISEVAEEYGLHVAYVQPGVIIDLMQKVRTQNFGARPERFLIDDALGGAFATAARERTPQPVEVAGPPWECRPHADGADAATAEAETGGAANETGQTG